MRWSASQRASIEALVVVGSSRDAPLGRVRIDNRTRQLQGQTQSAVAIAPRGLSAHDPQKLRVIGVAYDGKPEAREALTLAASLARAAGAKLRVASVLDDRVPSATWSMREDPRTEQRQQGGTDAEVTVTPGAPAELLLELSEAVDLVFIGSCRSGTVEPPRAWEHCLDAAARRSLPNGCRTRRARLGRSGRARSTVAAHRRFRPPSAAGRGPGAVPFASVHAGFARATVESGAHRAGRSPAGRPRRCADPAADRSRRARSPPHTGSRRGRCGYRRRAEHAQAHGVGMHRRRGGPRRSARRARADRARPRKLGTNAAVLALRVCSRCLSQPLEVVLTLRRFVLRTDTAVDDWLLHVDARERERPSPARNCFASEIASRPP